MSDHKTHDSVYTDYVICDLIKKFNAEHYHLIRIKSDNCPTQYCCLHVFQAYHHLSKELDKVIILYYGVNGHGRGLVDAMSGFGVKTLLRRAIVTADFMFNTAKEFKIFLEKEFEEDHSMIYEVIPYELLDELRDERGKPILGCRKARMISFFPSGKIETKRHLCNCTNCTQGEFNDCVLDDIDKINVDELLPLDSNDVQREMFTFIEENSYVAVYSREKNCSTLSRLMKNVLLMRTPLVFMATLYRKGVSTAKDIILRK